MHILYIQMITLENVLRGLDREIQRFASYGDDPALLGVEDAFFDEAEFVAGLGFVACQAYITEVANTLSLNRTKALVLGPKHTSGNSMVDIINAAANCWKHRVEWPEENLQARQERTIKLVESVGVSVTDPYVAWDTLVALVDPLPPRFETIFPFLSRWNEAIVGYGRSKSTGH